MSCLGAERLRALANLVAKKLKSVIKREHISNSAAQNKQ